MRTTRSFLLPLTISLAVLVSLFPIDPLIEGPVVTLDTVLLLLVPGLLGSVLALVGLGRVLSVLLTSLACVAVLAWRGLALAPGHAPTHAWAGLTGDGARALAEATLPIPIAPGITWLLLMLAATSWILTTTFAEALEQPGWAIASLALPFGIAAVVQPEEVALDLFLGVAAGYVAVLLAAPRPVSPGFEGSRWLVGAVSAGLAVALAVAVATFLPMGEKQPWRSNLNEAPIELGDPTVDLEENLHRPDPVDVLRYTSSDGAPHYLRTTAMTRITTNGAQLDSMRLRSGDLAGAYDFPGTKVDLSISMAFPSQYLPVPFSPEQFRADGKWGWDPDTLAVVATGQEGVRQSQRLDYTVTSVIPQHDAATIAAAKAGKSPDGERSLEVPQDVPARVADLLAEITKGAETDGQKALALVEFFQSDQFTYTLEAPGSSSTSALADFLLNERAGYCIHFSISMALLSRMSGIPARVAVGFTGGTADGNGFRVTTDNMHAWPELYFEGLGWVPFEPTKSYGGGSSGEGNQPAPPPSTESAAPTTPEATPSPSPEPTPTAEASPEPSPSGQPGASDDQPGPADGSSGSPWFWPVVGLLGLLVLAVLPAVIRWARGWWRLRSSRAGADLASAAWRELRDTFTDAGLPWEPGSPGAAAATMAAGLGREAATDLRLVADLVERTLYAQQAPDPGELPSATRRARRLILGGLPPTQRWSARLLPRSLIRPRRR